MRIPKIIHYCWFGPNPIPEKEEKCMLSWKKYFPNYEIKFWNENNFPIDKHLFAKQAYECGQYAFVSDYVRAKVLLEYGGLYFDTDLEILKSFDSINVVENCFLGFETRSHIGTAIMGFTPKHFIIKLFLEYYEMNPFKNKKGEINTIANTAILTDVLTEYGLIANGEMQKVEDIIIYPREYFYPKKLSEENFRCTDDTMAIHKCSNSWMTDREKKRGRNKIWINVMRPLLKTLRNLGIKLIGKDKIKNIEVEVRNILK